MQEVAFKGSPILATYYGKSIGGCQGAENLVICTLNHTFWVVTRFLWQTTHFHTGFLTLTPPSGYQDGKCFYCNSELDTINKLAKQTHVDHVIPKELGDVIKLEVNVDVDLIWNLVNACSDCNLSKSGRIPSYDYVRRVYERNEYYIHSNHPLADSIILAIGKTPSKRRGTVQRVFDVAVGYRPSSWHP